MRFLEKQYWIFDMDGTLTLAQHDFDAIRSELGLPLGQPILESIDQLPRALAEEKLLRLESIELEIALEAEAQVGACSLLSQLSERGLKVGILTRNSFQNTMATLNAAGLDVFFEQTAIISRECAPPKPSPEGIFQLLTRWSGDRSQAVMVGDYLFDMQCGREAGVTTVCLDQADDGLWHEHADLVVTSLVQLQRYLIE